MLTPLGKELRRLRIDRGWLLKDMADGVGMATSFLSGIENGRKSAPRGFVEKVAEWAGLDRTQLANLKKAELISQREFKVGTNKSFSDNDREAAALLARFGELPRETRDSIHSLLKRSFE